jgi:hypothetical protein
MTTTVEIDKESMRKMKSVLESFVKLSGKSVEEGIEMISVSAAKRLARNVQRFGLTDKGGSEFQNSIGGQVIKAVKNANVMGIQGNAEQVHKKARRFGRVPKNLVTEGRFQRSPIPIAEREELARKKKALAGRAKGAWIEAGNQATGKAITRIPAWVNRHKNGGYGSAIKTGVGLDHKITLTNRTPYLRFIQPDKMIAEATVFGLKSGYKRIQTIVNKLAEKANRELQ